MLDNREYKYEHDSYMLWDERWEKNLDLFRDFIQSTMDTVVHSAFGQNRIGQGKSNMDNLDIFDGKITEDIMKKYFEKAIYTYGAEGAGDLEDYAFFQSNYESLHGITLKMPTDISITNITPGVTEEKKNRDAEYAAAMMRNQIVMKLGQDTGQDVSDFLRDNMPTSFEQLSAKMNSPEEYSYLIMRLLTSLREKTGLENELQKADRYLFALNMVAARVYINKNDEPAVECIDPRRVSYVGKADIESLEDPSVSSASYYEYVTLQQATQMFGHSISKRSGWKEMKDALDKVTSGKGFSYNPHDWRYAWLENNPSEKTRDEAAWWSYDDFYDRKGNQTMILCQTVYSRLITEQKALLKYQGKDPSSEKVAQYHLGIMFDSEDWTTVDVEKNYKPKSSEHIVSLPKEEMWEFVRLGHSMLVKAQRYKYMTPGHSGNKKTEFPIIMMKWDDASMVERGKSSWRQHAVMMERASEAVNMAGISDVMLVDKAQKVMSLKNMLHSARKGGVIEFDSTQIQGIMNQGEKSKNLTTIKLGSPVADVLTFLQAGEIIKSNFEKMMGFNDQSKGRAGDYQGISTINRLIEQGGKLTQFFHYRLHRFRSKCVERYVDVIKHHYAQDRSFSLFFGKGEVEVLKSSVRLSTFDFETIMESGVSLFEEKQFILSMLEKTAATGANDVEQFVKLYRAEESTEILRILRTATEKADQMQQAAQQNQQQQLQATMQIESEKAQIPLQKEKMRTDREMQMQQIEIGHEEREWDANKDITDLQSQGKLDKEEAQQAGDAEKMLLTEQQQPLQVE